ncbi:Uu.00g071250.m01.CDS01 [Anthostomella pinea]|uniref:Uu.00g071250.m01.CDS01 n=1 Tax=Anthostomella pinea TaxID=933095 RepID=A0AAI8VVH3_9PEZI|nr:Uu.00g071250.m01.CDS01 [Anthostomella pinea]
MATVTGRATLDKASLTVSKSLANELTLPPQTTPFVPPPGCELSVYCYAYYHLAYVQATSTSKHALSGEECQAIHKFKESKTEYIGHNTACFPDGYASLFPDQSGEPVSGMGDATNDAALATAAYEGTACIADWTAACTTAVTQQGQAYSQAWCCPPGGWACTSRLGYPGETVEERLCISTLTEATDIFMSWDPPYTDETRSQHFTWTAAITSEPAQFGLSVYHRVFPLQLTLAPTVKASSTATPTTTTTASFSEMSGTTRVGSLSSDVPTTAMVTTGTTSGPPTATSSETTKSNDPTLSTGALAGIAAGGLVFVIGLFVLFFFLYRRRKKRLTLAARGYSPQPEHHRGADTFGGGKPELDGTATSASEGAQRQSELDAGGRQERHLPELGGSCGTASAGVGSPVSELSPTTTVGGMMYPLPEVRQKLMFEMQA